MTSGSATPDIPYGHLPARLRCPLLRCLNGGVSPMDEAPIRRLSVAPEVPSASAYSPSDGTVGWEGYVGTESERHRNIAVDNVSQDAAVP